MVEVRKINGLFVAITDGQEFGSSLLEPFNQAIGTPEDQMHEYMMLMHTMLNSQHVLPMELVAELNEVVLKKYRNGSFDEGKHHLVPFKDKNGHRVVMVPGDLPDKPLVKLSAPVSNSAKLLGPINAGRQTLVYDCVSEELYTVGVRPALAREALKNGGKLTATSAVKYDGSKPFYVFVRNYIGQRKELKNV